MTVNAPRAPQPTLLKDYRPPDFLIRETALHVKLDPARTIVKARLDLQRRPDASPHAPLRLAGQDLELISIGVDGQTLPTDRWTLEEDALVIHGLGPAHQLDIETACAPEANTSLSGLYLSNGMFCTQCEAEGFRRITYFLDRPDVLSTYRVRIEADKTDYPVLLANGNLEECGDLEGGRHFAVWRDPHPKPSYLFALVGGDLACVEDQFKTRSARHVALKVFVQDHNADKCAYTLDALKRAMRWDEETFGREYDLDIFMIVAVDHFNFGAMENKGLNIFNAAYVLASPETATDEDYETIESIVAHEYFHNWSGNRVTCRDWFQLCLKEGFTVFRDQEFSADMRSRAVQRIKDVRRLWAGQFPEDAGPLAHPPRPDRFITIDNFYTATVYEKGAEIARMLRTLLGPETFRAASDLYFERHDGEAATVEDFVTAMEDASGVDLTQFRRWYGDAGTPEVRVDRADDGAVTLSQHTNPTPGQPVKPPRHIPIAFAAYDRQTGARLDNGLISLTEDSARLPLSAAGEQGALSLLGGFSAPVRLVNPQSLDDRLTLMAHDQDPFNQWSATHGLWRSLCLAFGDLDAVGDRDDALARFAATLERLLADERRDPAFVAELLKAPGPPELAHGLDVIDPAAIMRGRASVLSRLGEKLRANLEAAYARTALNAPYAPTADQAGPRALKNAALALLTASGADKAAAQQAENAANMTDEAAAVSALAVSTSPYRSAALARFYEKWRANGLVMNKWLAWSAMAPGPDALPAVQALLEDPVYDAGNPNKVRAVIGVFARQNFDAFHTPDGRGYDFLAGQARHIDRRNPQLAARLLTAFESWRRLTPDRRTAAQIALEKIAATPKLSRNCREMADRLLDDGQTPSA